MVAASKHAPVPVLLERTLLQQIDGRQCYQVVHPWTSSCLRAPLRVVYVTLLGSSRLMLPFYAAQVLVGGWRPDLLSALRSIARSLVFGSSLSSGVVAYHCLLRYVLGRYTRSTVLFWPSFLAGLTIYVEDERRRPITLFYYFTWMLEWLFRRLSATWPAVGSRPSVTLLFMAASGALMWTLRRDALPKDMPIFWFFRPSRRSGDIESSKACPHRGTCWSHGCVLAAKYASVGVALQALRSLLRQWRGRAGAGGSRGLAATLATAFSGSNSLALFLGAYVALYQVVRCGLCRLRGEDRPAHALLAGAASGAAFWLYPDLTIAFVAVSTLLQLWVARRCHRLLLEPSSALCLSALMYAVLMDRPHCPPGFIALTDLLAPGVILGMHKRFFYLE